jgi:1,4-dihydroxy-2-naphthoyl-CoA hydrolase
MGALAERSGVVITEASAERVVGTMPVEGNTQPYGLLHGGASCVLVETLGSVGAALGGGGSFPVGVDINATHHRGVRSGFVTGVATPLYQGRTVATWAVTLTDDEGRLVCSARLTCALRAAT